VNLHPVILSGGSGTRLWPLSRAAYPKQLLALTGQKTLLQATVERAIALPGACAPLLVCNQEHRFIVREQCLASGHLPAAIYLEPAGRNTAPAIALAALHLARGEGNPDALMLVLPADHVIDAPAAFQQAVTDAVIAARAGYLVTFGIVPSGPETGYGYIQQGAPLAGAGWEEAAIIAYQVQSFVEKPDRASAEHYLAAGGYSWNSGLFVFSAGRYLEELGRHRPDILTAASVAWENRATDLDFCRPACADFLACPSASIDYAVMQATTRAAVVPAAFGWSDVGSWDSLWQIADKDPSGNALRGDTFVAESNNCYIRAESRLVAVIGLDDVVVVETADAVLVMHRHKSQEIKRAIGYFEHNGRTEHLQNRRVYRLWGWYEGVDNGERFQVKRIMVKPGEKLSLQMHHHRAEHWVVVSGTARVTVDGQNRLLAENQSTYIPLGHPHQLENPGKIDLHIIEVQSGAYLGEDDIVRFEPEAQAMSVPPLPQLG
jgi:mannose-1-phosphate guanylyltransferase/mannose-1-phosphate guanylyltransferase/mannose-6-phosphate isomerase